MSRKRPPRKPKNTPETVPAFDVGHDFDLDDIAEAGPVVAGHAEAFLDGPIPHQDHTDNFWDNHNDEHLDQKEPGDPPGNPHVDAHWDEHDDDYDDIPGVVGFEAAVANPGPEVVGNSASVDLDRLTMGFRALQARVAYLEHRLRIVEQALMTK